MQRRKHMVCNITSSLKFNIRFLWRLISTKLGVPEWDFPHNYGPIILPKYPPPLPPPAPPPRLHTCHVLKVNKRPPSCHCVAVGQVYFTAFCFSAFRVVSGCQTRYSSCRLLKVGILIGCDSVSLSSKNQRDDEVAGWYCSFTPAASCLWRKKRKDWEKLNLSTHVMALDALCSLCSSGHSSSSVRRGKRSPESGLPGVSGAGRSDVC